MQFEQDNKQNPDDQNIENILDDIVLAQDTQNYTFQKRDNTFFIIDCSPQIMTPLPGSKLSEFEKVIQSYKNFMMSKVIANCSDRVGLIFYNVGKKKNSLNFQSIFTVHQLETPSAKMIKSVEKMSQDFFINYGHSDDQVSLHQVLWLFGQEIKDCEAHKNHVRMFLFTAEDNPHSETDQRRDQAINHARQLAAKGAHIQLFPIRKQVRGKFDLRKFYQQIITFDTEDLNKNMLDNSSKIMDLQSRIRQKQFNKRTLNRLLMQIGKQTYIGVQIYGMFSKAKRPLGKKLESSSNKPLKRVIKRFNVNGEVLFNEQIGTYYPLGGQRVIISKEDMSKLKGLKKSGITLIGFKPRKLIKPYHNLRPSYFLYPDEDHVVGSTQLIDALIQELTQTDQIAIVSILPRQNQQFRFAALFPQKQSYDVQDHHQTPPGFHMIILPYSDDIVNFIGEKSIIKPSPISAELVKLTKLLINNLTVNDFDFRNFENPGIQKFYCHLQAHALNQQVVEEKKDTLQPDYDGMEKFSDIFKMVEETADAEIHEEMAAMSKQPKQKKEEKKEKKEEADMYQQKQPKKEKRPSSKQKEGQTDYQEELSKKGKATKRDPKKQAKKEQALALALKVQCCLEDGDASGVSKEELIDFLKSKGLLSTGSKAELVDRAMVYISLSLD